MARLEASVNLSSGTLDSSNYSWSCTPPAEGSCNAPRPSESHNNLAYWTAPDGPPTSGTSTYTLTLTISSGNQSQQQSVTVNVNENTGDVNANNPSLEPEN